MCSGSQLSFVAAAVVAVGALSLSIAAAMVVAAAVVVLAVVAVGAELRVRVKLGPAATTAGSPGTSHVVAL